MKKAPASLLLLVSVAACGTMYRAEPISARVVDKQTGQPLQGVTVMAHWEVVTGGLTGGELVQQIAAYETLTGSDGTFQLPGWGPRASNPFFKFSGKSPEIILLKNGYEFWTGINDVPSSDPSDNATVRRSDWSGKTIALSRFAGTPAEYSEYLQPLSTGIEIDIRRDGKKCFWSMIPLTIKTLAEIEQWLGQQGDRKFHSPKSALIAGRQVRLQQNCPEGEKFYREIEQ